MAQYRVGVVVEYHSASFGKWISTYITDVSPTGEVELARKPGYYMPAHEQDRLLRLPRPEVANNTTQFTGDSVLLPPEPEPVGYSIPTTPASAGSGPSIVLPPQEQGFEKFVKKKGVAVEYHSASFGKWISTHITDVSPTGEVELARKPGYYMPVHEQDRVLRRPQPEGANSVTQLAVGSVVLPPEPVGFSVPLAPPTSVVSGPSLTPRPREQKSDKRAQTKAGYQGLLTSDGPSAKERKKAANSTTQLAGGFVFLPPEPVGLSIPNIPASVGSRPSQVLPPRGHEPDKFVKKKGIIVEYHSRSFGTWISTEITDVSPTGEVELARKPGYYMPVHEQDRLLRLPQPEGANSTAQVADDFMLLPPEPVGLSFPMVPVSMASGPSLALPPREQESAKFVKKKGVAVEYHSVTCGKWISTHITDVSITGEVEVARKPGYYMPVHEQDRLLRVPQPEVANSTTQLADDSVPLPPEPVGPSLPSAPDPMKSGPSTTALPPREPDSDELEKSKAYYAHTRPGDTNHVRLVSLGCTCAPKLSFQQLGMGAATLPFDWVRTRLKGILHFLRSDFEGFFDYTTVKENVQSMTMYRSKHHSFWHDNPADEEMREKYTRRIDRFHKIDASCEPVLFVRAVASTEELKIAEEFLEELTHRFGEQTHLLLILDYQHTAQGPAFVRSVNGRLMLYFHRNQDREPSFAPYLMPLREGLNWAAGKPIVAKEFGSMKEAIKATTPTSWGYTAHGDVRAFEDEQFEAARGGC